MQSAQPSVQLSGIMILVDQFTTHELKVAPTKHHLCVQAATSYYFHVRDHVKNYAVLHAAVQKYLGGKITGDNIILCERDPSPQRNPHQWSVITSHVAIVDGIRQVLRCIHNECADEILILAHGNLINLGKKDMYYPESISGKLHKIELRPHRRVYFCTEMTKSMLSALIRYSKELITTRSDAEEYHIIVKATDMLTADMADILIAKSKKQK